MEPALTQLYGECESCGFVTVLCRLFYNKGSESGSRSIKDICELCANTETGRILDDPANYPHTAVLMRTVCYVGNAILKALKDKPL